MSLAELKQEVNAAKGLSNSASAVLQTNASLLNAQHGLVVPQTAALSARAAAVEESKDDLQEDTAAACERGPIYPPKPASIQWLATGVS